MCCYDYIDCTISQAYNNHFTKVPMFAPLLKVRLLLFVRTSTHMVLSL